MKYFLVAIYLVILVYTLARILLDTRSTPKTLAYLLLVILFPLVGILIYFSFGINYRHRSARGRGMLAQQKFDDIYLTERQNQRSRLSGKYHHSIGHFSELADFLQAIGPEYMYEGTFKLLNNGEEKFPRVLEALRAARRYIHMEYYTWENDHTGRAIAEMLIRKAREGVTIRILYDDYGSHTIRRNLVKDMKAAGISIHPQIRIKFHQFANRLNHRDHRKVIIVDGQTGFVGGINISDRYDNSVETGWYWRDTHMKMNGPVVSALQRHFIVSWNACPTTEELTFHPDLFPVEAGPGSNGTGQVVAGGPIYPASTIMLTYLRIFTLARHTLYITNPYFIPSESVLDDLKQAAYSGVDVRLLLPAEPDSRLVGAATRFYFRELLESGVRIFLYQKGFIHAKTLVSDGKLSVVGTANLDIRSFDLNFEIMAVLYSEEFAEEMERVFLADLANAREVTIEDYKGLRTGKKLLYACARLISSFL